MDELNELKQQIDNLAKSVRIALENEQEVVGLLGRYEDVIQTLQLQIFEQTRWLNNLKYELNDPRTKKEGLFYPVIKSQEEAIDRIVNEGKSLARFGDGEFSIMENIFRQKFQ